MSTDRDDSARLVDEVVNAAHSGTPLVIRAGGSKARLGPAAEGRDLQITTHRGIVHYDPPELVLTARAGTPLIEIEAALAERGQMLPCEPPHFSGGATWGGMVAAGLSGPRRPWAGAVRDFVLGCRVIDGQGRLLRFGGEVMKNVAGYDVSRLMAGAFGSLGVLTEISMKVLPVPRHAHSLRLELPLHRSLELLRQWARRPLPLSAAAHDGSALLLRLEGGEGSVTASAAEIGGETLAPGFWQALRDQQLPFFTEGALPLWRLSLPPATPELALPGSQLIDWGGAQRWLRSDAPAAEIRALAESARGHAERYGAGADDAFHPLDPALLALTQRLKQRFDPQGLFNRGRLYSEL